MFLKFFNLKGINGRSLLLITLFSASIWSVLAVSAFAQSRTARLYSVEGGTAQLMRPNWSTFYDTFPPTRLNSSDLLRVEPGMDVVLLCPGGDLQGPIPAGDSNVGSTCFSMPRSVRPSFGVSNQWSANDSSVPYVITPWAGQVLTPTPMLRWNAADCGQTTYKVTLQRRTGESWTDVWSVVSEQASMAYPNDQPGLEPGEEYVVRVVVGDAEAPEVTEEQPVETAVFSLVGGEERQAAMAAIAAVNALDIDAATKTLILVEDVYPQYKLFAQGINELNALIESGTENANIHRLLGDYYIRSGLALPAQESYTQAIALATVSENLEEEALAMWGIGTVYGRMGEQAQARTYLEAAEAIATTLGDPDLMAGIGAELTRIRSSGE
jgi:hypothetical protein